MSTLHSNAIITGSFDSYCLLCEVHLKENVEDHINVPEHKEKLQHSSYVQKYKFHHIRKVLKGYYCEFCNILLPTLVNVGLHVTSNDHECKVGNGLLKEVDGGVTAFDRMFIDNQAWNGLIEDTICCLCNEEFNDKSVHIKQHSHILHLIQKGVHMKEHGILYRNVDTTTLHCMVCNIILEIKDGDLHFDSSPHLEKFRKSCDLKNRLDANSIKTRIDKFIKQEDKPPVIEHSTCVNNKETDVKKFNDNNNNSKNNDIIKTQEDTKTNAAKTEPEKSKIEDVLRHPFQAKEEAKILAKKNKINYKFAKQSAYCSVCNVTISSSLKRIKEHIEENNHKKNLQRNQVPRNCKKDNINIIKIPIAYFVNGVEGYENKLMPGLLGDWIVLNGELCMKFISYSMITVNCSLVRCQACKETVDILNLENHSKTSRHEKAIMSIPVVLTLKGEFVRVIHSGLHHCGFCNLVVGDWEDLTMHLESDRHHSKKYQCYLQHELLKCIDK
ncbi:protein PFC0760c-like isoform X2 [Pieris brassicae]|uniref:C2H2-type domain-containing protein n=2 Tax=Pieris brassicae TaxID=7116 RepID=A0A9P0TXG8_PIEBR|nr:protein PFC0760c-like isoform X2 [Pieris brassicae]XP_045515762.1 protein PFC0760c-like isoform X2 [Pieris brassicae]CAH4035284.1 unnamed protein product [Pieris brassicae]